jgi:hypothetical protein
MGQGACGEQLENNDPVKKVKCRGIATGGHSNSAIYNCIFLNFTIYYYCAFIFILKAHC